MAAALLLALGNCTTDSPTEPRQNPVDTPGSGGGAPSGNWNIQVTSTRAQLEVNSTRSAVITVRVRDAVNGALPPNGAVITVTTTLGEFDAVGSGVSSVLLQLLDGLASVALFPGDEVGTAIVQARLENSIGQISIPIVLTPLTPVPEATPTALPPDQFFLDHVEPNEGSPEGGEEVIIFGQEIETPVRVFFGGNPADVLGVTSTRIRVRTPRNDAVPAPPAVGRLPVDVEVTINVNEFNQASDTLVSGFTYVRGTSGVQPVIFSVTPNIGPNEGGTRITINGDGFQSPVQVTFEEGSSVLEAQVESVSRTQLVVISPPAVGFGNDLRNQQVDIRVRNQLNGLEVVRASAFRYGIAFSVFTVDPSSGPFTGGTRVTIFGEGFDEPLVVDFGDLRQQVLSVTGNQILVRTVELDVGGTCSDVSLPVLVTHLETNQTAQGPSFTFLVEQFGPDINAVIPSTIPQSAGNLTIQGSNFGSQITVRFRSQATGAGTSAQDRPIVVNSASSTQISGTLAPLPDSDFNRTTCDDNGDNFLGQRFLTTPAEITVRDDETTCAATFNVNIQPANTSCRNDVAPTPTPLPTSTPLPTVAPTNTPIPTPP